MNVGSQSFSQFYNAARHGALAIACGPIVVRIRGNYRILLREIQDMYADYPTIALQDDGADFSVHIEPLNPVRRFIRPSYHVISDKPGPFAPLPGDLAFVGFEMAQNWQIACTHNRHLVFHASVVASAQGGAVLMPGQSGSGKTTLAAALGFRGWRFLGDEFGLFCLDRQCFDPLPRPISLKNESIETMLSWAPDGLFSRVYENAPKGRMIYLQPPSGTLEETHPPARLSAIVFPNFNVQSAPQAERMRPAEAAVELMNASVNFDKLGVPAFDQIMTWANTVPAYRLTYPSLHAALALIEDLRL